MKENEFYHYGSYLCFGFQIKYINIEKIKDFYMSSGVYKLTDNIYIKEYGVGTNICYFLFWSKCFRGGSLGYYVDTKTEEIVLDKIDIKEMLEIQISYKEERIRKICDYFLFQFEEPGWQTICCYSKKLN